MLRRAILTALAATHFTFASASNEDQAKKPSAITDIEITTDQCYIYSRAAAHALMKGFAIADSFEAFGDFKDMVLMEDVEDKKQRVKILQTAICPNLCDKSDKEKHPFCKEMFMELEMDDMSKVGLFKTVIKTKEQYVKPALAYAKVLVKKVLEKAENVGPENWDEIDAELEEFVEKNFDLGKAGTYAQKLVDKMGMKIDVESMLKDDPAKLFKAGKAMYNVVKEKMASAKSGDGKEGASKMNFDLGSLLPEAQNILGKLMNPDGKPSRYTHDEEDDENEPRWLGDDDDDEDSDYEDYEEFNEAKDEL